MPGHENTFSTNTAPAASAGSDSPTRVMVGEQGVAQRVAAHDRAPAQPLGQRGAHPVAGEHVEQRGALVPRDHGAESRVSVATGSTRWRRRSAIRPPNAE